ncbi:rhodanese-like domain-containing protein [Flavobacteriaceae bacterium R38]|nr:rhodanese-like domain-containing protein [Flavobacteriaceae bacterium R38]
MRKIFYCFSLLLFFVVQILPAQQPLYEVLKKYNKETIPYITVEKLSEIQDNVILIDSREKEEFEVSHIKDALYVGYDDFKIDALKNISKNQKIVVYCSLGVRSETIARKLKKQGYTNIYNLYGGIFEWKNKNLPIVNNQGKETNKVHAFSKEWGVYLKKGIKVYE